MGTTRSDRGGPAASGRRRRRGCYGAEIGRTGAALLSLGGRTAGAWASACGGGLRFGLWLGRGHLATKSLGIGLAADAVGLRVLDRGRMALDPDAEGDAEIQRLFVGEPELTSELVDPDLLGHLLL